MNGMNNSTDESVDCPLCMEPLEVDDLNFYPCTCGYQICRFCWHRIRTDENELCPACRKAYPENPADFKPLTQEQITAFKAEKRQRDQQRKQKITENRKHLANVRVVQKNLVFVVGLPPRLADADILKKHDYFGKYGKIHKVVINPSTTYAGVQGPSASAYVTYVHNNDALRAIQNVNNITIDGRQIKTSLGTTKYCSHFMKNQQCPKGDCMYLHELGDQEASFTKEEMHQCKHQEYEKRLHDALIASTASQNLTAAPLLPMHGSTGTPSATEFKVGGGVSEVTPTPTTSRVECSAPIKISNKNNGDNKLVNGNSSNSGSSGSSQDAWPSLSVSPVNSKEGVNGVMPPSSTSKKGNKDGVKEKGSKKDKKSKKQSNHNKENQKDSATTSATTNGSTTAPSTKSVDKHNTINEKEGSGGVNGNSKQNRKRNNSSKSNISPDDEVQFIEYIEKECNGSEDSDNGNGKNADTRSLSSSSSNNSDSTSSLSESTSGKSSPGNEFSDHSPAATSSKGVCLEQKTVVSSVDKKNNPTESTLNVLSSASTTVPHPEQTSVNNKQIPNSNLIDSTAAGLSNLNLFDCNNSFLVQSFHPMLKKLEAERGQQLPDLINGIDSYQNHMSSSSGNNVNGGLGPLNGLNNLNNLMNLQNQLNYNQSEDWEQVLKMAMMRNNANKQLEERNNLLNMMGNGLGGGKPHGLLDFNNSQNYNGAMDPSSLFPMQRELQQHSQQLQNGFGPNDNILNSDVFGPNMSKFFDFHKNQQQQQQQAQQQNFMVNGHNLMNQRDHHMGNLMDARVNRQFLEQQQMNQLGNKFDSLPPHHMLAQQQQQTQQKPPNRMSVFPQMSSTADDDLGFDPFIETQKGLAELIENEHATPTSGPSSSSSGHSSSRPRMPPPGFNHIPPSSGHNNGFGPRQPPHFQQSQQQQQQQSSKMLSYMNNQTQANGPNFGNGWNLPNFNFGMFPQQQQQPQMPPQMSDQQMHMGLLGQNQNGGNQHKGFGSISDWTSMDPAILSFRQYPSFSSQQQQQPPPQIPPHLQNTVVAEKFMQHLAQQHQQQQQQQSVQQQNGQGFGHHGAPNPQQQSQQQQQQQASQAQVNFSQANWLNTDHFMNSFNNSNNSFEKFSIPIPPGITLNSLNNHFNKTQPTQKTECIN